MKILLISLQSNTYVTGLKYIAANVFASGHDAKILLLPGYMEETLLPSIEGFITDYNPDLIGIGLMSIEYYPAKNLTILLREKFRTPIIWGGVHAIMLPEECVWYADYVCSGEGERTVVELLEHLSKHGRGILPDIPNLWVNDNANIIRAKRTEEVSDLNSLPLQEYLPSYFYGYHKNEINNFADNPSLFRRYALYGGTCHMMITSRGCPFDCSYCGNSFLMKVYGNKVRERAVDNCIKELKEVKKDPYIIYINIEDDWFLFHSIEWLKQFCEEYKKHINLPFMIRVFPSNIDREKIFLLRDAGLSWVIMGVQSGSDRINFEVFNRRVHFSSVIKAAEMIAETKAAAYYEMIVDNPYETEEEQIETINSVSKLKKPFVISLSHLTFMPGTPITGRALKDGIAEPEAYLTRFLMEIDHTYFNKLLYMTPYLPRFITRFLNRPQKDRGTFYAYIVNILFFMVKRSIEPAIYFFITTKALNYNITWTAKTVIYNWRSAVSILLYNFLGKQDIEFDEKLKMLRKIKPALIEK